MATETMVREPWEMTKAEREVEVARLKRENREVLATPLMSGGEISPFQVGSMGKQQKARWEKNSMLRMDIESRIKTLESDERIARAKARAEAKTADETARTVWLHTKGKWIADSLATKPPSLSHLTDKQFTKFEARRHAKAVKWAIAHGKPVPAEVLKDYPELGKKTEIPKARAETTWQKAQAEASERIEAIENEWVAKSHVGTTKEQQARVDATIVEVAKKHHVPASTLRKAVLWEATPAKPEPRTRMTVDELEEWLKSQPESAKSKVTEAEKAREESHREHRPHYNPVARAGERWTLRNYYGDFVKDASGLELRFRSQDQAEAYLKRKAKPVHTPKPEPKPKKEEAKTKLIGKQDTFYIGEGMAGRGVAFKPVKGRRVMVPGYEDYEFFAHGKTGAWKVTDAKTGAALTRLTDTTKDAIAQAKENLDKFGGKAAFDKRRAEMVKESGVSPQFKSEAEPKAKPEPKPQKEIKALPPRPSGIQIKQSDRALAIDRALLAKQVVSVEDSRWLKRPNRFDVRGIDTPGRGRIVAGVAYADKGKQRLSRKHHRGFSRIKFT